MGEDVDWCCYTCVEWEILMGDNFNDSPQGRRQNFAWVGASTRSMRVLGDLGVYFKVHFSSILRVNFTLPLRLSGPLQHVRGCGRTHCTPLPMALALTATGIHSNFLIERCADQFKCLAQELNTIHVINLHPVSIPSSNEEAWLFTIQMTD